ncbi:amino acid transporter [Methylorubrum populi]
MSNAEEEVLARAKTIHNERAKLTATYVNGVAIAVFAVGGLAPIFAVRPSGSPPAGTLFASAFCLCISAILHWAARRFLKELR